MMTQEQMNVLVPEKLRQIEVEKGVRALCAAESGSRAWGFSSPDSDFDVRFIYIRPRNDYLRLDALRDVIEMPIDDAWDVSGWDLQKALRLLWKSNPSLFEWAASPIQYLETGFEARFVPLTEEYFEKKAMMYHYLHAAGNTIRAYLRGATVRPKKYFYAIRPVLACQWVLENNSAPPIRYADLVETLLPGKLKDANDRLLDIKINNPEAAEIERVHEIDAFLDERVTALGDHLRKMPDYRPKPWEPLNRFFLSELERLDG